jgi:glutamate carboxypeptidase
MASLPGVASLAGFDRLLPRMLTDLAELVTCESPSADQPALAGSARLVAGQGTRALGVEPELLVHAGCPHLRWRLGTGPRRVLVLGHHDTVWPLGTLADVPWSVEDGVVRGPGCFDMKAGLVQAFTALGELRAAGADLDGVTVLVTGDEEIGSPSSADLIRTEATGCDAVLVLEASADGGALKTGRKGASMYEMVVTGRAAHAGLEPEKGVNTTVELAHQVLAIAALADPERGTSVTPTVLTSGATTNTVPAAGRLGVDVRALTAAEQQRVDDGIRALAPQVPGAVIEVRGGINRPPLEEAQSAGLFALAQAAADRLGLPRPAGVTVGGASDGNFTAGIGVPTLDGLGAVGGGAHALDEHLIAAELPRRAALLAALVESVLDRSPAHITATDDGSRP